MEDRREYHQKYHRLHKAKISERHKRWWASLSIEDKEKETLKMKAWVASHKESRCEYERERIRKIRVDVLTHYGNGKLACIRCGFEDIKALTIDHINGGGSSHRRLIGKGKIYQWLRRNNYPDGYQVLCMNCQFIKG